MTYCGHVKLPGMRRQKSKVQNHWNSMSPIPESSPPSARVGNSVSAMCQQLSQGLSLLASNDDFLTKTPRQPTTSPSAICNSVNEIACNLYRKASCIAVCEMSSRGKQIKMLRHQPKVTPLEPVLHRRTYFLNKHHSRYISLGFYKKRNY